MPVVQGILKQPGGSVDARARVTIDLVGADPDIGFVGSTDTEVVGRATARPNSTTGVWSATLVANSLITPANTVYKVTVQPGDGPRDLYYVSVPNGAGPYWVGDIVTTAPVSAATDLLFGATYTAAGTTAYGTKVAGDSFNRLTRRADGTDLVGDGTRTPIGPATIDARTYGVDPANPDNYDELTAAITAAAATAADLSTGAVVLLPRGVLTVAQQIVVKNKVTLLGAGKRGTIIKAAAAFATSTPIVRLGDGTSIVFDSRVENLCINANNIAGSICVYSNELQEGAGCFSVLLTGYRAWGIDFADGCSLFHCNDLEVFPSASGSTGGIRVQDAAGYNVIANATINGTGGGSHGDGVYVRDSHMGLTNIHVEGHTDGLDLGGSSSGFVAGTTGHGTITNLINVAAAGDTKDWTFVNTVRNGSTNILVDGWTGLTYTDNYIRVYTQYEAIIGGARIISRSATPEGAITARRGSLFLRTDGGAGTTLYVKESGTGNTGWVAK